MEKVHNEELHSLYRSSNMIKSKRLWCPLKIARIEEGRSAFKISTSKSTGKRTLGRPKHRW
jgi:hypothetical protein